MHLRDLAPVRRVLHFAGAALLAAVVAAPAFAQALDTPTMTQVGGGFFRIDLDVHAGGTGAPNGFGIQWMKKADFEQYGWPADDYDPLAAYCSFTGDPTLNPDARSSTFRLAADGVIGIQMGDLFDETGLYGSYLDAVEPGDYAFRVWAEGDGYTPGTGSNKSAVMFFSTVGTPAECTQGFWKNHGPGACHSGNNANVWPASCFPLMLGNVAYTQTQICSIFNTNAGGNGLISLAHQLITTKMNICNGSNPANIAATVAAADAMIGNLVVPPVGGGFLAPGSTSSTTNTLDNWNNGTPSGVVACVTPTLSRTWGAVKAMYR